MPQAATQYTVRGVMPEVDSALRKAAKQQKLSLNAYLVQQLSRLAEEEGNTTYHHDLDFAIGSMKDSALVDEALAEFSRVDASIWE